MLLLFTTSAQTHIFPEIRIDAIRFLDLYLDLIPEIVVGGWRDGKGGHGKRVLGGYLGVLNAGTKFGDDGGVFSLVYRVTLQLELRSPDDCFRYRSSSGYIDRKRRSLDCSKYSSFPSIRGSS